MSIEDSINALTAAVKELTVRLGIIQSSTPVTTPPPQPPSESAITTPSTSDSPLEIPSLADKAPAKPKGKTKDAPATAPEAPSETKAKEKPATYEDAATVLISKDKAARKALIKTFKESAEYLVDLTDMGEDIWTRVIEAAKGIPEKS